MDSRRPPLETPAPLLPPALLRVQGGSTWASKGRGKARDHPGAHQASNQPSEYRTHSVAVPEPPRAPIASSSRHDVDPSSAPSQPRKVGLLGIPLSDSGDEDTDEFQESVLSSESVEANPPVSPVIAAPPAPAPPTYSRGGSTRSGPSTRGDRQSEGAAFVSEENFRDIVDDLTLQNQQLRAKLKRLESAKVPTSMKDERLFEVRFFQGLPKSRRREIETFLTDYVQTLSTADSRKASTGSIASRGFRPIEDLATIVPETGDTVSSIGRSLRSSEKDAMARATLKADADAADAAGSRGSGAGSASRSGTGSGNSREQRRARADGVPQYDPTPSHEPLGSTPILSTPNIVDPPSLLRRPTDIFPPDRDVLAAPSFSGVEPVSTTGTGHEMRISDPFSRKRKRLASTLSNDIAKDQPRRSYSTRTNSTNGSTTSHDPDTLETTIVQMIECLFLESLPPDSDDESPGSPPANPLQSEPFPLPARSSSNTQYLRTILRSEEYRHVGGWVYLNIVATFAALHRLSASISTVRHALRTKSDLVEVSGDGSKIRWKGPARKPPKRVLETQTEVVEECHNALADEKREQAGVEMDVDRRDHRSRSPSSSEPATESIFDDQPNNGTQQVNRHPNPSTFATSTAPTSLNPTMSKTGSNSKNGSEWQTGGSSSNGTRSAGGDRVHLVGSDSKDRQRKQLPQGHPLNASSLRNSVEEVGSPARRDNDETMEALGSGIDVQQPNRHHYTPLFAKREQTPSTPSEDSRDSISEACSEGSSNPIRLRKRRKGYEGGVVYFSNDLFCSDLAGDFEVRAKLKLSAETASASTVLLGDSFSRDAMETDETESGGLARSTTSGSKRSETTTEQKQTDEPEADTRSVSTSPSDSPVRVDDRDLPTLEVVESAPLPPELYSPDAYLSAPRPALRLSAMSDAVASDHFTIHIKRFHRFSPTPSCAPVDLLPSSSHRPFPRASLFTLDALFPPDYPLSLFCTVPRPSLVESKTLHHHPSVFVRPPRVLMSLSSDASDSESDSESITSQRRHRRAHEGESASSAELRRRRRRFQHSVLRNQRFESSLNGGGPGAGAGGDYLMSLALPLNRWAPVTKRSTPSVERLSSSRAGTGSGEPSESLITLD
ncbi:hypothetical protein JCM11491_005543 [Sporobolomyces phaffii]